MKTGKKNKKIIKEAISYWKENGLIDTNKAEVLDNSIEEKPFNWKSLAFYSFIFAMASFIIAIVSIFADKELIKLIDTFLEASYLSKTISFIVFTVIFYLLDLWYIKRTNKINNRYSKEIFALLCAVCAAISIGFLSFLMETSEKPGFLIIGLSIIYLSIGYFRAKDIYWLFGLVAILIGFGSITVELSNSSDLFLGMNFPLRFTIFTALLYFLTKLVRTRILTFYNYTSQFFLVLSFTSLWILSISGNYSNYQEWLAIRQYQLWFYSIILLLISCIAIIRGIKEEDSWMKNIGILFIFINLYTRYFEFFWDNMHKAVFFFLIALSFWLIGKKAEKIWSKIE